MSKKLIEYLMGVPESLNLRFIVFDPKTEVAEVVVSERKEDGRIIEGVMRKKLHISDELAINKHSGKLEYQPAWTFNETERYM
jgi:hypothetical protein